MNLPLKLFDFLVQLLDFPLVVMLFTLVGLLVPVIVLVDGFGLEKVRLENRAVFFLCAIVVSLGD
jgi:hypothetical protein